MNSIVVCVLYFLQLDNGHTHTHVHTYTNTHIRIHAHTHTYAHIHTNAHTHTHIYRLSMVANNKTEEQMGTNNSGSHSIRSSTL